MPETREPRSVVDAAEQAAAAGDYASAEQLLREAALLQEASLGPLHPDLANTLNNLGVVCEITEKPVDAEQFFRRASAIATAVLEPDHPFVATSRKNLEDFCTARGRTVDSPGPSFIVDDRPATLARSDDLPPVSPSYEQSRPDASGKWFRSVAIGGLIAAGLLLTFIATGTWFRSTDEIESTSGSPSVSPATPATPAASPPAPSPEPRAPSPPVKPSSSVPTAAAEGREKSSVRTAAAVGDRRGTLPGTLNRRKRLALRSPKPSSRSGHALLLHADQVSGGYNSPTSLVSRRPVAPGGRASHSRQHHRRLSYL